MTDKEYAKTGWVVFGQPGCRYCVKALDALDKFGAAVSYINIEGNPGLRTFLKESGLKTVPQVYHHGHLVGGSDMVDEYIMYSYIDEYEESRSEA